MGGGGAVVGSAPSNLWGDMPRVAKTTTRCSFPGDVVENMLYSQTFLPEIGSYLMTALVLQCR